jgi:F-type H+-transporting ATPase subunit delta
VIHRIVANRYAQALFAASRDAGLLDRIEADFPVILGAYESNPELKNFLEHPAIGAQDKKDVLARIFKGKVHDNFLTFLYVLVDKNRENQIEAVQEIFEEMLVAHRGQVRAVVQTAYELPADVKQQLSKHLSTLTGKQVDIQEIVDPALLGGVYVRMGDRVLDGTVRSGLARMKETLLSAKVR